MAEPPAHALPLRQAFDRFIETRGSPTVSGAKPPIRDEAAQAFCLALLNGELVAWARRGSPLSGWIEVPAAAWRHCEVLSWSGGVAGVAKRTTVYVTEGVGGGRSRTYPRTMTDYEEYFDTRVAKMGQLCEEEEPLISKKRRYPSQEELAAFYLNEHVPKGYSDIYGDMAAVRGKFGRWPKDRDCVRALRRELAPDEWRKPGPKSGAK